VISTRPRRACAVGIVLLVVAVALSACGGGSESGVVATVGHVPITRSTLDQRVAAQAPGSSATHARALQEHALSALISVQWLLGEAAELGLNVSDEEVQRRFETDKRESAPNSEGEFREFLEQSGETPSQLRLRIRAELAAAKIRGLVAGREREITATQVADFYRANEQRFVIPEERTIDIVETKHEAEAIRDKREVESGRSVASEEPLHESFRRPSHAALLAGEARWRTIMQTIFAAAPGALTGPMELSAGWSVFVVRHVEPPVQRTLSQVAASIKQTLAAEQHRRAIAGYVAAWTEEWTARTDCRPGYVVAQCRQYRGPRMIASLDPFGLG
jgi:foldase protein PrsA